MSCFLTVKHLGQRKNVHGVKEKEQNESAGGYGSKRKLVGSAKERDSIGKGRLRNSHI